MIAFCALTGREMSVDLAQEVLSELWGDEEKIITIEQIQRKVGDFFGVKMADLKAKNRTKAVAFPRQIAMYLARQLTHSSLVRGRPRLRRQGSHDRPARGGQDPAAAAGRSQTHARRSTDLSRASPCDPRARHGLSTRLIPEPRSRQVPSPSATFLRSRAVHSSAWLLRRLRSCISCLKTNNGESSWKSSWIVTRSSEVSRWSQNIVEPRQTLPVLANVLLETAGRQRATDRHRPRGRRARHRSRPRWWSKGAITSRARKLAEIVKELPAAPLAVKVGTTPG